MANDWLTGFLKICLNCRQQTWIITRRQNTLLSDRPMLTMHQSKSGIGTPNVTQQHSRTTHLDKVHHPIPVGLKISKLNRQKSKTVDRMRAMQALH
jgi:hypothetical protein